MKVPRRVNCGQAVLQRLRLVDVRAAAIGVSEDGACIVGGTVLPDSMDWE